MGDKVQPIRRILSEKEMKEMWRRIDERRALGRDSDKK